MHFRLAYKEYPYKPTWKAFRDFQEDTGESMLGILNGVCNVYNESRIENPSACGMTSKFLAYCPEIIGSKIFYYLAKESNNLITLDELQDAVFHSSNSIPAESDSFDNPWYLVLVKVAGEIIGTMNENALKKKQLADS